MKNNWRTVKIKDICSVVTGGTPRTGVKEYWDGDINWMSSGEVNKRRVNAVDRKITELGLQNSNARMLPVNTVMIALAGQGKTRGKVAILEVETSCNQSLAGMIRKDSSIEPEFLFQYLESKYQELRGLSGGEGRSGLNLRLINNFEIKIPDILTQNKVALILKSIDTAISKTDQIIQKLELLKYGLMNNLFTNNKINNPAKINKGEISSEWQTIKFDALFSEQLKNGLNRPTSIRGSGVKMVNMGELFKYPIIEDQEMELVPLDDNEINYFLETGDLLFARQSLVREGAGKCAIFLGKSNLVTYEGHIIRVRLNKKIADPLFYFYYFNSPLGHTKIESLITVTAAAGIRGSELSKLNIIYPPLIEQIRISNILSSLDSKINFELSRKKRLEALKLGIMQDIFNQKVQIN